MGATAPYSLVVLHIFMLCVVFFFFFFSPVRSTVLQTLGWSTDDYVDIDGQCISKIGDEAGLTNAIWRDKSINAICANQLTGISMLLVSKLFQSVQRESESAMIEKHRTRIDKICQTVRQSNRVLDSCPTPVRPVRSRSKRHGLWVRMAEKK